MVGTFSPLVHVEIALEDPLLHSVRNLGLHRHFAGGRLHNSNALGPLVTAWSHRRGRAGHGAPFGTGTEIIREVVTFACEW
jgi:hypothetical protein